MRTVEEVAWNFDPPKGWDTKGLKLVVNSVTLTTVNSKSMFCNTSNNSYYFSYKER
ncbi:hypothetical protein SAMN03159341_10542 [Paenibacillus sp. 1_12]|nr:hypothetical protein SAMN03159341_10542 [Paenibacillus sp. 1_12]